MVWWVPLAAAAVSAAGSLAGGERKNAASISTAREQMAFQEYMYKHRYQMQMDDMRAAGLNPILSYSQGPPGAPGGAQAQISDTVTPAIQSGVSSALGALDAQKKQKEVELLEAQKEKTEAETKSVQSTTFKTDTESVALNQRMEAIKWQNEKDRQDATSAAETARVRRAEADRWERFGRSLVGENLDTVERMLRRMWQLGGEAANWVQRNGWFVVSRVRGATEEEMRRLKVEFKWR